MRKQVSSNQWLSVGGQCLPWGIWKCGDNFGYHRWGRLAFSGQEPGMLNNKQGLEQFHITRTCWDITVPNAGTLTNPANDCEIGASTTKMASKAEVILFF